MYKERSITRFIKTKRRRIKQKKKIEKKPKQNFPDYINEIKRIKKSQTKTNTKLDFIINKLILKKEQLIINTFNFEYLHRPGSNHHIDYFSFKIKPNRDKDSSINSGIIKKTNSPDNLLSHKFFEDIDNFRNLMDVKTIEFTNNAQNPFCTSLNSGEKSKPEVSSIKDDGELSAANLSEIELEKTNTQAVQVEKSLNSENYCESANSSKYMCNSSISQERFKKVRGFNFKNHINTRKFIKPLLKKTSEEVQEVETLSNRKASEDIVLVDQDISEKIKKFNLKKFVKEIEIEEKFEETK